VKKRLSSREEKANLKQPALYQKVIPMKNYPGKWPIHFSTLLDLRRVVENSAPNARHARAFRFSGAGHTQRPDFFALELWLARTPSPQRPEEGMNLLHMCMKFTACV
ncbi:MAG TPA: hypothetical protein VKB38_24875, partial [Terracidiphilus sp.]|nr:hypothetical protein [Terracidiphilus sp.]